MKALELINIHKSFGDTPVLSGVSLEVEPGSFCVLLGPSGCGKSTLLRLVAGLDSPDSGEIRIEGKSVINLEPKDRDVAMVFQSYALYPHLSVFENLAFPLRLKKIDKKQVRERVGETAGLLNIEKLLDRLPRELSGGQRQRVAIGRALVRRPRLFLFDEPLSNLDAQLRAATRAELARLHRKLGVTVLYVTHDQIEAMTLGNRIGILNKGRFEQTGTPSGLYLKPENRFVASFIGDPSINLIEGNIKNGFFSGQGLEWNFSGMHGAFTLGIRPEDIEAAEGGPWKGTVDLVENLGAHSLIHVRCGRVMITVRLGSKISGDPLPKPGTDIALKPRKIHFFDPGGRRVDTVLL